MAKRTYAHNMECGCGAIGCVICKPHSKDVQTLVHGVAATLYGATPFPQRRKQQNAHKYEERVETRRPAYEEGEEPPEGVRSSAQRRSAWRRRQQQGTVKQRRGLGSTHRREDVRRIKALEAEAETRQKDIDATRDRLTQMQQELTKTTAAQREELLGLEAAVEKRIAQIGAAATEMADGFRIRTAQLEEQLSMEHQSLVEAQLECGRKVDALANSEKSLTQKAEELRRQAGELQSTQEALYRAEKRIKALQVEAEMETGKKDAEAARDRLAKSDLELTQERDRLAAKNALRDSTDEPGGALPSSSVEASTQDGHSESPEQDTAAEYLRYILQGKDLPLVMQRFREKANTGRILLDGGDLVADMTAATAGVGIFKAQQIHGLTHYGHEVPGTRSRIRKHGKAGIPWAKYFGVQDLGLSKTAARKPNQETGELVRAKLDTALLRRECRGLVLNEEGVVARPMQKFFQPHQGMSDTDHPIARQLDSDVVVEATEKLDGSMVYVVPANDGLELWTKSGPTKVGGEAMRFAMEESGNYLGLMSKLEDMGYTAIFEWMGKQILIRVRTKETRLVLTQARCKETGEYMSYEARASLALQYGVEVVDRHAGYEGRTWTDCLAQIQREESVEGFVLRMKDGSMLKAKTWWFEAQLIHTYERWHDETQRLGEMNRRKKKLAYMEVKALRAVVQVAVRDTPSSILNLLPQAAKVEAFYARDTGERGAVIVSFRTHTDRDQSIQDAAAKGIEMHRAYSCRSNSSSKHRVTTWYPRPDQTCPDRQD